MTRNAVTRDAGVIPGAADEGCRGVTVSAIQAGRKMPWIFTGGRYPMTRIAPCTAGYGTVIECRRDESARGMTNSTILNRQNMTNGFACRQDTVMTGLAVIDNASVVKGCRNKARGDMALTTVIVGRHMVIGFSEGGIAIVTGGAVIYDAGVIKPGASKVHGVMTYRAVFRGGNMIQ